MADLEPIPDARTQNCEQVVVTLAAWATTFSELDSLAAGLQSEAGSQR